MKNWILLLLMSLAFFSCSKEGPTGPQGPEGPPGNANVITTSFTNRSFTANPLAPTIFQVELAVPTITTAVLQKGLVSVFIAPANNNNAHWLALPGGFTPNPLTPAATRFFNFQVSQGAVVVFTTDAAPGYNADFKVVVVPAP